MKSRSMCLKQFAMACLAGCVLSGCYSYHEVAPRSVAPGSEVRVRIASEEAVRQVQVLGGLRETIEGEVANTQQDGAIGVIVRRLPDGPAQRAEYSSIVMLPNGAIIMIEEKRFNAIRTAMFAGGATAAALAALAIRASATSNGGEPPPINELRIPLIRW